MTFFPPTSHDDFPSSETKDKLIIIRKFCFFISIWMRQKLFIVVDNKDNIGVQTKAKRQKFASLRLGLFNFLIKMP